MFILESFAKDSSESFTRNSIKHYLKNIFQEKNCEIYFRNFFKNSLGISPEVFHVLHHKLFHEFLNNAFRNSSRHFFRNSLRISYEILSDFFSWEILEGLLGFSLKFLQELLLKCREKFLQVYLQKISQNEFYRKLSSGVVLKFLSSLRNLSRDSEVSQKIFTDCSFNISSKDLYGNFLQRLV